MISYSCPNPWTWRTAALLQAQLSMLVCREVSSTTMESWTSFSTVAFELDHLSPDYLVIKLSFMLKPHDHWPWPLLNMIVFFQNFFPLVNVIAAQNLLAPKLTLPRVWLRRKWDCCLDGSSHPWSGRKIIYDKTILFYVSLLMLILCVSHSLLIFTLAKG